MYAFDNGISPFIRSCWPSWNYPRPSLQWAYLLFRQLRRAGAAAHRSRAGAVLGFRHDRAGTCSPSRLPPDPGERGGDAALE